MRAIDNWFLNQPEPSKSTLLFLRDYLLHYSNDITEVWQYGMPFYRYKGKRCCYLWVHKKLVQPYIGIVDGNKIAYPDLLQEKRARMKIFLIDPEKDVPVKRLNALLESVLEIYTVIK